jgi:alpha-L-arabinofuranosidase
MDTSILVNPSEPPIDDKLYSGFLEHLGRCIYGGIVDNPKAPSPEELLVKQDDGRAFTKGRAGWRKDVMQILAKDGELEIPMLRWPGGETAFHSGDPVLTVLRQLRVKLPLAGRNRSHREATEAHRAGLAL